MGYIMKLLHTRYRVNDMDEFASHIKEKGPESSDGPTKSSSGSAFAFTDAPEGYEIELIQPARKR